MEDGNVQDKQQIGDECYLEAEKTLEEQQATKENSKHNKRNYLRK